LDVTIQAQVLELLKQLVHGVGSTALLITHDLGVIAETSDYMGVMYAGRMVEFGRTDTIIDSPLHPYTQGLLRSSFTGEDDDVLHYIPGVVPNLLHLPDGCTFAARCHARRTECETDVPEMVDCGDGHEVACWLMGNLDSAERAEEEAN
jgi:oligopeptide/dipeptide ABC transporter ATP-binding protein